MRYFFGLLRVLSTSTRHSWPLSSDGSIACNTYLKAQCHSYFHSRLTFHRFRYISKVFSTVPLTIDYFRFCQGIKPTKIFNFLIPGSEIPSNQIWPYYTLDEKISFQGCLNSAKTTLQLKNTMVCAQFHSRNFEFQQVSAMLKPRLSLIPDDFFRLKLFESW